MENIALNMIVGPFREVFLSSALLSAAPLVDEVVIIDTFPQDNPNRAFLEMSKAFLPNMKIVEYDRPDINTFDYSAARNLARDNTESEWILRLDADEVLNPCLASRLIEYSTWSGVDAVAVKFWHHMIHPDYYVETNDVKRILLRKNQLTWFKPVHEHAHIESEAIYNDYEEDSRYNHYGYVRGPEEVYSRWKIYDSLGGLDHDITKTDPKLCINNQYSKLMPYRHSHPMAARRVLRATFRDIGTWPLEDAIKQHRELEGIDGGS